MSGLRGASLLQDNRFGRAVLTVMTLGGAMRERPRPLQKGDDSWGLRVISDQLDYLIGLLEPPTCRCSIDWASEKCPLHGKKSLND